MNEPAREVDLDKLKGYAKHVFGMMSGATTSAMIYIGDRLGLFATMAELGPVSSTALAEAKNLDERWVREWLYQQGAAGILDVADGEIFSLSPEAVAVLVNDDHPAFGAGTFAQLPSMISQLEHLPEIFETGRGVTYDSLGAAGALALERGSTPWFKTFLLPAILPKLGLVERLQAGAKVADIGCGGGALTVMLAEAFPNSEFHGYDISSHALDRANQNVAAAGIANATFHDAAVDPLPASGDFDFVMAFDCLHDMADPRGAARSIREAIADDGVWLITDIKARDTFAENVAENPMAALMYGFSMLACLASATSEPDGEALGTLGFTRAVAEEITNEAGFARFEEMSFRHPTNTFYVVQP
ncbi:MAG TPA: class I SAM-dependent methyltransferase [Actinobacteria bacterium]|nr:class I SAM-dependent methyltransferase [Actinomycetota bacterium]